MQARLSYRVSEFATATGISRSQVYNMIAAGQLKTIKVGKMTLISADEVQAFFAAKQSVRTVNGSDA